mgnify:CR=1 FL=1|tara:strand:- start:167 stop:574 length:408 start_codon:yes stop_codon:yes gene_type:complete
MLWPYGLLAERISMKIKINRDYFMPKIKERFGGERRAYHDQSVDFADDVLEMCQEWMDEEPWNDDLELDTRREMRINLTRYIKKKVDFTDHTKSYFLPTFVWVYLAQAVIGWIVKQIIEYYWTDIRAELPKNKNS